MLPSCYSPIHRHPQHLHFRKIHQKPANMRWSTILTATCSLFALGASSSPIDIDVKDIKVLLTTATGGSEKTFK